MAKRERALITERLSIESINRINFALGCEVTMLIIR
jgi:hypothetical protein